MTLILYRDNEHSEVLRDVTNVEVERKKGKWPSVSFNSPEYDDRQNWSLLHDLWKVEVIV